jgi:hypothetical protein
MMSKRIVWAVPALVIVAAGAFAAEPPPSTSTDASPAVDTSAPTETEAQTQTQTQAQPDNQAAPARRTQNDRLDLDTTIVTGNRELPKVLYIVPWKKADLGDLPAQPFNTLLDEVLTPVDRDVFRREVTYYGVVSSGASASPAAPADGDEK